MYISAATHRFILQWGELGSSWGINRTVAQIHALLYVSPEPLDAEEIAKILSVARSNVSGSLKELQSWGIVKRVHRLGDRRDRFEALADVWEMARVIAEERKRREIDPTSDGGAILRRGGGGGRREGGFCSRPPRAPAGIDGVAVRTGGETRPRADAAPAQLDSRG